MFTNLATASQIPVSAGVGTLDCQLTDSKDADFLAGFIAEFTGNDHKAYFETCYHDSDAFKADICTAVNAFSTKDGQQVLVGVQTILADMPELKGFLAACPDAAADIAVVNNWMHYWRNAGEMAVYQTAYKNIVPNMKAIVADADQASADYAKGDWYQVAFTAGTIARTALPIMTMDLADDFDCGLTDIVVADLMAGFMMEMPGSSGVSHQAYMEGCFKSSPAFLTDMCAVANDFATKDNQKVLEGIQKVLGDFPQIHTSMAACPEAMPDWTLVGNWFKFWKAQGEMKVYQAAYTNFTHNMAAIEGDFSTVAADFSAKDFFGAGRAANWGSVLVLPPPATMTGEAEFLQ